MFDPILVPLDGSLLAECVLSHTVAIAQAYEAKAIILTVLDKDQQHVSAQLFDLLNWQIHKAEVAQYLGKIDARLGKLGLHSETIVQEGSVAESIIEFAQNQGAKLIILSSHGHSGVSQWGISSVAQKIILERADIAPARTGAPSGERRCSRTRLPANSGPLGWLTAGGKCAAHDRTPGSLS